MSDTHTWTKESAHHFSLRHGGQRVDLRYEPAGFQSGWAVYDGPRLVDRRPEFMQARGVALKVASGRT
ncbi:hypothetical protein [Azospirillum halopraeferens]|uniref:hypothetical protein n=1 Tax=Azospirillum halopraeferens TaxID=34010 RepID=UPI0003FD3A54|nr:hypothetical protein [Azospirillum halopraeferens]